MDKEPTKEQIKEFWEWCGFKIHYFGNREEYWLAPGETGYIAGSPSIDLNNLFKYAVPKLAKEYIELEIHLDYLVKSDSWNVALLDGFYGEGESKYLIAVKNSMNPAIALFWAIYSVLKSGKDITEVGK